MGVYRNIWVYGTSRIIAVYVGGHTRAEDCKGAYSGIRGHTGP